MEPKVELKAINHSPSPYNNTVQHHCMMVGSQIDHGLSLNLPFNVPAAATAVAVAVRDPDTAAAKIIV